MAKKGSKKTKDVKETEGLAEVEKMQKELGMFYANLAVGKEKNLKKGQTMRKEIARIMTKLNEKNKQ